MKKFLFLCLFVASFSLFWGTNLVNRTEADDAFEYAWQIEHGGQDWLYHPHHLLYGAITKGLYNGARLLGYEGRAYPMLRLVSALCGAGAILMFFRFCYRRFSMRPVSSLLCAGLLLFSYGFWRYANEAEVIVPACFFMLFALYFSVNPEQTLKESVVAGVLCGTAVLFHILNLIPVFMAIPLFYLLHRNWKGLVVNAFSAACITILGYAGVYFFESQQIFDGPSAILSFQWSSFIKALVGFSQCIVSSNFMLGFGAVRDMLVTLFPTRMLLEEVYLGQALPSGFVWIGVVTLICFVFCFLAASGAAVNLLLRKGAVRRRDRTGAADGWMTLAVTMVWFLGYAGAVLLLEPGNPEVWVMGLVPFWLVFCGLIAAPLSRDNRLWVILLLLTVLAMHNYTGGIRPLQFSEGDYNRKKTAWVIQNTYPDDVVLTAGSPVFERYLRYFSPARVEYLYNWSDRQLESGQVEKQAADGTVYILGDVFDQPLSLKRRFPGKTASIARFAEQVSPMVVKIHEDEFGGVYMLESMK